MVRIVVKLLNIFSLCFFVLPKAHAVSLSIDLPAPVAMKLEQNYSAIKSCWPPTQTSMEAQRSCMVCACFWEAQGESALGQEMVARTVYARASSSIENWPNDFCGVVHQEGQFEWTKYKSKKNAGVPANHPCNKAVHKALTTPGPKPLYFHGTHVKPDWDYSQLKVFKVIDKHIFYFNKAQKSTGLVEYEDVTSKPAGKATQPNKAKKSK